MNYPQTTGYVANSATSKASAEQLDKSGNAASQAGAILACLKRLGVTGATADELTVHMKANGFPAIHNGTVAGRLVHLELNNEAVKTRKTRETRAGRDATVYVHADFKNEVDVLVTAGLSCLRPYLKEMHKSVEAGQVVVIQPDGEFAAMLHRVFGQV